MFMTNDPSNCAAEEDAPGRNADAADYLTRQAAAALLGTTLAGIRRRIYLGEYSALNAADARDW